jgi:glycosyltransferase involved in cell wall biosynthesis
LAEIPTTKLNVADSVASAAVIVVNWNSGRYLRKCLHAVLNQTIPVKKIIVVDNASTDASLLEAEDLLPHVQLVAIVNFNAGALPWRGAR